jgi:hypothetical protein
MRPIAAGQLGTVAAKYGEQAPMATVCCNACRTCVTANLLTIGTAAAVGLAAYAKRLVRR